MTYNVKTLKFTASPEQLVYFNTYIERRKRMAVICVVGYPGSGKSTVARLLEKEYNISFISMGDVVREQAKEQLEAEEQTSQAIGDWIDSERESNGHGIVAKWTTSHISEKIESESVVIEGVRSPEEVEQFQALADHIVIVSVECPKRQRLKNLRGRGRENERSFSTEDLTERDLREESWGLQKVMETSDVRIINNSTYVDFIESIEETFNGLL